MGINAAIAVGEPGQFNVFADGERVATRNKTLWTKLTGGGWPKEDHVIASLQARLKARA